MKFALNNGRIFTGSETVQGKSLLIAEGKIIGFTGENEIPSDFSRYDLQDNLVAPGLLDLQIYGGGGFLFSAHPEAEALSAMSSALCQSGTTGFLLTLATNTPEIFSKAIETVLAHPDEGVLGLHLEGPYLNPVKRGAHIESLIRKPEYRELKELLEEGQGAIKMITLAPELADEKIIDLLLSYNVIISAGHSNASFRQATAAFDRGVQSATHLFNAMSPFHHRDIGLPGAVMQHTTACSSIIPDGIHVDYETLKIAYKLMGERLFLITDAVEACSTGPYLHQRAATHFTMPDGTLSGSSISLLEGVRNCVQYVGLSLDDSLRMASTIPARLMNLSDRGRIEKGCRADMILINPHDLSLKQIIFGGEVQ